MKKILLFPFLLISIFGFIKSYNAQCIPDNSYLGSPFGIYSTVNDTFYLNVPSSKSYTVTTFTDAGNYSPLYAGYYIDSIKLVSVTNLPAGLNYSTNNSNFSLGGVDCINISGVYNNSINSSDSVGFKFVGCVSLFGIPICDTFTTSKLFHFYDWYCYSTYSISSCDSYSWNGNTYTQSGVYTDTIISGTGCDSIVTLDLIINNSSATTIPITACDTFTWDGVTYDSTGIYTKTYSGANSCDSVVTLDLIINVIQPNFSESSTLLTTIPFSVQFTNSTPNLSNFNFTWDFGDNTVIQNNSSSVFHQYMYNGLYDVSLIAVDIANGCGNDTLKKNGLIFCSGGPGLSINEKISLVNIYPNPTNENITISINNFNGNIQTEVYDLIGNRLQTTNETTISLQDYARGIYLLKVSYSDRVEEMKVIKD